MLTGLSLAAPVARIAYRISKCPATAGFAPILSEILDTPAQVAFLLTAAKVPLAVIFCLLVNTTHVNWAAGVMAWAILLDIFDGVIFARSRNRDNMTLARSRRVLDAVTDRTLIGLAILAAATNGLLPPMIALTLVAREVIVIVVVTMPFVRHGHLLRPNMPSRVATTIGGLLGILSILNISATLWLIPYVLISAWGLFLYLRRPVVI